MNFAPYILQSAREFRLSTTRSLDECIAAIEAISSSGGTTGKNKPLVGSAGKESFFLHKRPGLAGAFFAPTLEGTYALRADGTDVLVKTGLNKLGKALLNAAVCTILGAVIGVIICITILPDAVAVSYAFLCMVLIPALVLVLSTGIGQFVIGHDTRGVMALLTKQLEATMTDVPAKPQPVMATLMQEWYATPATVVLFAVCAFFLHNVYSSFWAQGDYIETETLSRPVYIFTSALLGEDTWVASDCRFYLAESLRGGLKLREAAQLYDKNVEIFKKAQGSRRVFLADNMYGLARIEDQSGRHQEAEDLYRNAIDIWSSSKELGPNSMWVSKGLDRLGMLCLKEDKFEQAIKALQRALQIDRSQGAQSGRSVGEDLNDLALIYDKEDILDKADATYKQALEAKEQAVGKNHFSLGTTLNNLADVENLLGHKADAERFKKRADRIWLAWLGVDFHRYPDVMQQYRELVHAYNCEYERPNADTRVDGLRPYLGRY